MPPSVDRFRIAAQRFLACKGRVEAFAGKKPPDATWQALKSARHELIAAMREAQQARPDLKMLLYRGHFFQLNGNEVSATPEKTVGRIDD